jgi:hypothetical protein
VTEAPTWTAYAAHGIPAPKISQESDDK